MGFVGLGNIGLPMAENLLRGADVVGYDVNGCDQAFSDAGGVPVASLEAVAAAGVETVFLSLPHGGVIEQVVFGAGGLAEAGFSGTIVDLSTIGPEASQELAAQAEASGITWVDCPVSGGVGGAEKATLAVIVACSDAAYDALEPILVCLGTIYRVGETPGMAQVAKLSNNFLSAVAMVATSEALSVSTSAGVDPAVMLAIMARGTGANTAVLDKFPNSVLNRRFSHGFTLGMMLKDMRLFDAAAARFDIPINAGLHISDVWSEAVERFSEEGDFTNVARVYEDKTGVRIESSRRG